MLCIHSSILWYFLPPWDLQSDPTKCYCFVVKTGPILTTVLSGPAASIRGWGKLGQFALSGHPCWNSPSELVNEIVFENWAGCSLVSNWDSVQVNESASLRRKPKRLNYFPFWYFVSCRTMQEAGCLNVRARMEMDCLSCPGATPRVANHTHPHPD